MLRILIKLHWCCIPQSAVPKRRPKHVLLRAEADCQYEAFGKVLARPDVAAVFQEVREVGQAMTPVMPLSQDLAEVRVVFNTQVKAGLGLIVAFRVSINRKC
jgi:hypothetical protein